MDSPFVERSKSRKGYSIESQTKEVILNLSEYFEKIYSNFTHKNIHAEKCIEKTSSMKLQLQQKLVKEQ
jgi:hypothetical protein